ncbi:MAG TPA: DNA repair protein RadA [Dehalococcoidia bacterium]|nr:DNA repair protein RadA [Dehalococcoidia bacterium]
MAQAKKERTLFVCQECGVESLRWQGRCPECGAWNTFVERTVKPVAPGRPSSRNGSGAEPVEVARLSGDAHPRLPLGIAEFDRVLGGGAVPGSLVLIGGDPGIGKCLAGNTRVLDPSTGDFLPITAWATQQRSVVALAGETHRLQPRPVAAFCDSGVQPIVEVTTRLGRVLRCTASHPLLTPDGWRSVSELAAGGRIASPRALPYFGRESLGEHDVRLIAYALSDGSATSQVTVTSALPYVERDLEELAHWYGLTLRVYPKRGSIAKQFRFVQPIGERARARGELAAALKLVQTRSGITWAAWARRARVSYGMLNLWRRGTCVPSQVELERLASAANVSLADLAPVARERAEMRTPVARLLESVGVRFSKARTKAVPEIVFRLPRPQLALFLRVLFSCDGSVYVNGAGTPGISYSTKSRRLADDVQHLLLRFGFVTRIRTKHSKVNDEPYTAYELQLLGVQHVKRFLSEIGIWGREEARRQIEAMPDPDGASTHWDTIPTSDRFWAEIRAAIGSDSKNVPASPAVMFRTASALAGVTLRDRRHDRPLARKTVAAVAKAYPSRYPQQLVESDTYWDEIASVTPVGEEPTYDLTVCGDHNFVANDLIVHNSTLLLQVTANIASNGKNVLYISGEESAHQLKLRAARLGITGERLFLLTETDIDEALATADRVQPDLVVVDSIQTAFTPELPNAPGTVVQLREATLRVMRWAKRGHVPAFIVGHVTKEGEIAGPRLLEHLVDVVLYLEGERFSSYRLLRGVKNRYGATSEVGVFEMANDGLREVENPSEIFLAERAEGAIGSVIVPVLEGTRPMLVEVQALTTTSSMSMPRRAAHGIETNRLLLITAVLAKRVRMQLHNQDVIVNVAGGLRVQEPAADLGLALAITSSFKDLRLPGDLVAIGEVGLSGELRSVGHLDRRLAEAEKLGFRHAILPAAALRRGRPQTTMQLHPAATLVEGVEKALAL